VTLKKAVFTLKDKAPGNYQKFQIAYPATRQSILISM